MNTHSRTKFIDEQSSRRCTAKHHEDLDRADPSDLRLRLVTKLMFFVVFLEDTKSIHEAHAAEECEETSDKTEACTKSFFSCQHDSRPLNGRYTLPSLSIDILCRR